MILPRLKMLKALACAFLGGPEPPRKGKGFVSYGDLEPLGLSNPPLYFKGVFLCWKKAAGPHDILWFPAASFPG
jgi:hypothetical protein